MVGFIKKERGGAPSLSFVTSLKVEGIAVSCWLALSCRLVLGDIWGGQLAGQKWIALVFAFFDLAIPASKADLDHFFVLPIKHALSVLQVRNQSVDFLSRNLNVSGYVRAFVAFLVFLFDSELNEVDAEVRHGLVKELGDDGLKGRVDYAVMALLCVVLELCRQLPVKAHLKVA